MHQYHLGNNEEEKDGELVVSKVFYQTQPRQCGSSIKDSLNNQSVQDNSPNEIPIPKKPTALLEYYNTPFINHD